MLCVRRSGVIRPDVPNMFFIAGINCSVRLTYIRPITGIALDAVYSTIVESIGGWVALQSVENRIGGSEGYVDVCIFKQTCNFVYEWAEISERGPDLALCLGFVMLCVQFMDYSVAYVIYEIQRVSVVEGYSADCIPLPLFCLFCDWEFQHSVYISFVSCNFMLNRMIRCK
jgi:hypothetical protein